MSTIVTVVNEEFSPSENQEVVLQVFKDEQRVNPLRIRDVTGLEKQRVNDALGSLVDAGWIRRVNRGLYEFVEDPRE
ncbi:MarR family transcriptional regulator [Haladaptatus paucihalophilus]|uniref:MarR family transcriptional regulator n=1 Tax=Haladaptatus paucihalophilus TaxID=367189 RepID=UPI0018DEE420|nr:helix-turn-helix domain-containing protein [Haladaptatus paucihalophilus]